VFETIVGNPVTRGQGKEITRPNMSDAPSLVNATDRRISAEIIADGGDATNLT
jgi:hypothetical protein